MGGSFKRHSVLALVLMATACASQPAKVEAPLAPVVQRAPPRITPVCRTGSDGGLPAPVKRTADRGIGGTGGPASSRVADRGIGGTGIVGVITGFASVCVDGLEVAYDRTVKVDVDGAPGSVPALRAGQVVVVEANGPMSALKAHRISVRSEVVGQIEGPLTSAGTLMIGGQTVKLSANVWGVGRFAPGDWVAVSGLRQPDGVILATRLDPATQGTLLARGPVTIRDGVPHLGEIQLPTGDAAHFKEGEFVTVSGAYDGKLPQSGSVVADTLCPTPTMCLNRSARRLVQQAFVRTERGAVWVNDAKVPARLGVGGKTATNGLGIVWLERRADGSYLAVGLKYVDPKILLSPGTQRKGGALDKLTPATAPDDAGPTTGESPSDVVEPVPDALPSASGPGSSQREPNVPMSSAGSPAVKLAEGLGDVSIVTSVRSDTFVSPGGRRADGQPRRHGP